MKKLIPFITILFICEYAKAQSPINDFTYVLTYRNCDYVDADFYIDSGSQLDWDSLCWHYGDGVIKKSSSTNSAHHHYSHPGIYSVSVDVWKDGVVKTVVKDSLVTVYTPMEVTFSYTVNDTLMMAPLTVLFTNETIPGECDSVSYVWEIFNGQVSAEKNMEYTFSEPGLYYVTLTASDTFGCEKSYSESIFVKDTAQRGEFPYITSSCPESEAPPGGTETILGFIDDTLYVYGVTCKNCCTEKTATIRYFNDTIYIKTWDSGEFCTCSCPFYFQIKIPGITRDSVYVYFDNDLYLAKKKLMALGLPDAPELKIYPNPARNYFVIANQETRATSNNFEILDLTGKILQQGHVKNPGRIPIDKNKIMPGLVIIRLKLKDKIIHAKLLVQ